MAQFLQAITVVFVYSLLGQCYSCTNVTLNCTGYDPDIACHELACLKMHWSQMPPYAYLERNSTTPHGILIG